MRNIAVEPLIRQMTDRIVERFHPEGVILFGSRARGTPHAHSDVDLLVVVPGCSDLRHLGLEMDRALYEFNMPVDVVVATPELLRERGDLIGNVFRPALREGVVLYGSPRLKKRYEVSEATVLEETRDWLGQVDEDLAMAAFALRRRPPLVNSACFHSQQALEKLFKAVLIWLQLEHPYVHELAPLRDRIPDGWSVKDEPGDLVQISKWVTAGRYPDTLHRPGLLEARDAVATARRFREAVRRDLAQHGFPLDG